MRAASIGSGITSRASRPLASRATTLCMSLLAQARTNQELRRAHVALAAGACPCLDLPDSSW
eukprot:11889945-Alexandrium_andersonii.AAC.1